MKIKASGIEINPWHVPYSGENDLALVKLEKSVLDFKILNSVGFICLSFFLRYLNFYGTTKSPLEMLQLISRDIKVGENVTFAGWGLTDKPFNKTALQYGFSSIISAKECSNSLLLSNLFVCTENPLDKLVGTCEGDSGGL